MVTSTATTLQSIKMKAMNKIIITAKEIFNKWCDLSQSMDAFILTILVESAMKEYAKLMCDKQKEICAQEAECTNNFFEVDSSSIINAPYPEELQ